MAGIAEQPTTGGAAESNLTRAEKHRGVVTLLANTLLMHFGFFMLFPLISVHFTRDVGLTAAVVGVVLAVRQFTQQGLTIFGGALAERIGYRWTIALGMFVRAVGFVLIGFAEDLPLLLAGAVVSALGGALFEASGLAAMAALTDPAERPRRYSLVATAGGIGSTVGPLLGVILLRFDFRYVSLAAAACFFLAFALSLWLLPHLGGRGGSESPSFLTTVRVVWCDRPFVIFTVLLAGYWYLFTQLFITVPLRATRVTGDPETVGILYAVNSVTLILLTYITIRWISRRLSSLTILQIGIFLMGAGLGLFGFVDILPSLIAVIFLYSVGRLLSDPMVQTITAQVAVERVRAAYFGFGMLAIAFGGSIGQIAGGWLYDQGQATGLVALPWIACFLVAVLSVAGLLVLRLSPAGRRFDSSPTATIS